MSVYTQSLSIYRHYLFCRDIILLVIRRQRNDDMDYRVRLRDIREDRDYTQAQIGKILHKSQQGYNHIEVGRAELKIDDLVTLCRFYNLSADYIIGLTNKSFPLK
ncbi:MAG: helix-turn-helix transcriptional regulator [Clostridiales bacterium]|nr:helix-turn-helix transcriptional regulator [Clostridiales bacterium]